MGPEWGRKVENKRENLTCSAIVYPDQKEKEVELFVIGKLYSTNLSFSGSP